MCRWNHSLQLNLAKYVSVLSSRCADDVSASVETSHKMFIVSICPELTVVVCRQVGLHAVVHVISLKLSSILHPEAVAHLARWSCRPRFISIWSILVHHTRRSVPITEIQLPPGLKYQQVPDYGSLINCVLAMIHNGVLDHCIQQQVHWVRELEYQPAPPKIAVLIP